MVIMDSVHLVVLDLYKGLTHYIDSKRMTFEIIPCLSRTFFVFESQNPHDVVV